MGQDIKFYHDMLNFSGLCQKFSVQSVNSQTKYHVELCIISHPYLLLFTSTNQISFLLKEMSVTFKATWKKLENKPT